MWWVDTWPDVTWRSSWEKGEEDLGEGRRIYEGDI